MTRSRTLQVHPEDDVLVALVDLAPGERVPHDGQDVTVATPVPHKHKLAVRAMAPGERLKMYGLTVAEATQPIRAGELLTPQNVQHATETPTSGRSDGGWRIPDTSRWQDTTFAGYHRANGRVGTRNYWIVVPLVFCENRNLLVMRDAMLDALGYSVRDRYAAQTHELVELCRSGCSPTELLAAELHGQEANTPDRLFPNVDGLKFLVHNSGCGEQYSDSLSLCGLLAGYIANPNVAGATVLSLGCQKSQIADLEQAIHARDSNFSKPLFIFEQQAMSSADSLLSEAIKHTFVGMMQANSLAREPAPLSEITLGVECGGSDGYSGITANPAIGHASDLLVALGGSVILAEFPELAGCETALAARCQEPEQAQRFLDLMAAYGGRLATEGSGFDSNPSPGNVRDGLTTGAIKSAGAARKGGTAPIAGVLDYPEPVTRQGLNLLCTPGGDVESTTAMAGSGANVMLFSTGLGTPTGNAVAPVIKVSSNSSLATRLPDLIDEDAGPIVDQGAPIELVGERLLERVIATASGQYQTRAEQLGQDDFLPWRRGLTL